MQLVRIMCSWQIKSYCGLELASFFTPSRIHVYLGSIRPFFSHLPITGLYNLDSSCYILGALKEVRI